MRNVRCKQTWRSAKGCRQYFQMIYSSKFLFRCGITTFKRLTSIVCRYGSSASYNYELIYSFSYARVGSTVNRLKLIQTAFGGIAVPIAAALEHQAVLPANTAVACFYTAVGFNIACYSIGHLFYRLIGKVYLDKEKQMVKLSYVGFFGKRQNFEMPLEEVLPLAQEPGYLYSKVHFQNKKPVSFLKLQEKYSDYCNYELAREVFGESFMRFSK